VRHRANSLFGQFVQVSHCPDCGGAGSTVKERCAECGATGRLRKERTLKVRIPAGVSSGNYLTLEGEGHHGPGGSGSVVVEISEKPHELFLRQGDDVAVDLPISFATAVLGGKVKVPTLKGEKEIEVPAGTQPGTVIRIRGAGIRRLQGGTGDELVRIQVQVPRKLSRAEKKLLQELEQARSEPVSAPHRPE
jgi:molecular chaperone DnaJ